MPLPPNNAIESADDFYLRGDEVQNSPSAENELMSKVFDALDAGVFIVNQNLEVIAVNSHFEKVTHLSKDELLGRNVQYLLDQGYISDSVTLRVLDERQPVTRILNYRGIEGNDVLVTGKPIFDDQGDLRYIVCTLRDWTLLTEVYQELHSVRQKSEHYKQQLDNLFLQQLGSDEIIARDRKSRTLFQMAARVAKVDATVLLLGESGVGKDVLARFIHHSSTRSKEGAFVHVNCGAIPESLFESELFGYIAGAFTGASKLGKPGLLEIADKGTLFLDEVAELPLPTQSKLLKALQEKCVMRLGDTKETPVDIKVIAATNQNLESLVSAGKFRRDLYYRLNVFKLRVPSLRERKEDIPPLTAYFLRHFNEKYRQNKSLSPEVLEAILNHDWPGNIRELEHTIEQMLVLCPEDIIRSEHLPDPLLENVTESESIRLAGSLPLKDALERIEKKIILNAIRNSETLLDAANQLGIDLSTLTRKKQKYGIFRKMCGPA